MNAAGLAQRVSCNADCDVTRISQRRRVLKTLLVFRLALTILITAFGIDAAYLIRQDTAFASRESGM